jgi:putative peptide zinc metalloprotease protein
MTSMAQTWGEAGGARAEDSRADELALRLMPGAEMHELDSSSTQQAYLLTLPDGRNFQLAAPLYHLASLLDGERTHAQVATALSDRLGRQLAPDDVAGIIDSKLWPLGILVSAGDYGAGPTFMPGAFGGFGGGFGGGGFAPPEPAAGAEKALGINARMTVLPARFLEPLAETVKYLYHPLLAIPILALIVVAQVYAWQQLLPRLSNFDPITSAPPLFVLLLGPFLVQLTVPWHELGHAAAARYFGAKHGPLGVGFMGLMLAAYVEVTDIWRLPRKKRLMVDLGGVYFQSMAAIVLAAWAWATGDVVPLWMVLILDFAMLMNVNPLFKLDGYWAVSDSTGITNLHQRVGEQVRDVVAGGLLRVARLLHLDALARSERLQRAANAGHALSSYGPGARMAIALYSVLFVLTAIYFVMMMVFIGPILVLTYPMFAALAFESVVRLISGTADIEMSITFIMRFVFSTFGLVALAAMLFPLLMMALGRRPRPLGWR